MGTWLKNIKGQLSGLASEILQEDDNFDEDEYFEIEIEVGEILFKY